MTAFLLFGLPRRLADAAAGTFAAAADNSGEVVGVSTGEQSRRGLAGCPASASPAPRGGNSSNGAHAVPAGMSSNRWTGPQTAEARAYFDKVLRVDTSTRATSPASTPAAYAACPRCPAAALLAADPTDPDTTMQSDEGSDESDAGNEAKAKEALEENPLMLKCQPACGPWHGTRYRKRTAAGGWGSTAAGGWGSTAAGGTGNTAVGGWGNSAAATAKEGGEPGGSRGHAVVGDGRSRGTPRPPPTHTHTHTHMHDRC